MPNYDYRCNECGEEFEQFARMDGCRETKCPKCNGGCSIVFKGRSAGVHVFQPMWYKDIDVEPIFVTSKRQLKEECDKRGLIAARLL